MHDVPRYLVAHFGCELDRLDRLAFVDDLARVWVACTTRSASSTSTCSAMDPTDSMTRSLRRRSRVSDVPAKRPQTRDRDAVTA